MSNQWWWEVKGKKYFNKIDALIDASKINSEVRFCFHDDVWQTYSRHSEIEISLNDLYRTRAEQIRDKYDYLVLYYSGGSDSHNILRTFLDAGIHLDEVCVKWPKPLQEGKFYTPNNNDTSPENFWSEWDYSIKPVLSWLAANTKIKINVVDPISSNVDNKNVGLLEYIDWDRNSGAILLNDCTSDTTHNKSIGHIYGIDKPLLCLKNNSIEMFFSDFPLTTMTRNPELVTNSECFYWCPDLPLLTIKMAKTMAIYYACNPHHLQYLTWKNVSECSQFQNDISRLMCYTTWDNRFQASKPRNGARNDKYSWFNQHQELSMINKFIKHQTNEKKQSIDKRFLSNGIIKTIQTKSFPVLTL